MYKLIVSELAHEDLRSIIRYIKETLYAPKAAVSFSDEVQKCYQRLKTNPFIFPLCSDERLAKENYRKSVIKNYILVFKTDEEKKVVNIYRFFFGAEDYPNKI